MKRILIFCLFCSVVAGNVWAVNSSNREVTVERDYDPTLGVVKKHVLTPDKEEVKPLTRNSRTTKSPFKLHSFSRQHE